MMTSLWSTRSSWARIDTKYRPGKNNIMCHKQLWCPSANPFSQQAIPFLPLTRHAVKQAASSIQQSRDSWRCEKNIPRRQEYTHLLSFLGSSFVLSICLSVGHQLHQLSVPG